MFRMRALRHFFGAFLLVLLAGFGEPPQKTFRYLPLGDSYTICTGAKESESWPLRLTQHLNEQKIACELLGNPARNGFSTQDLIDYELPLLKKLKPDLVTVLIGVNDWVREVEADTYAGNLRFILDEIQSAGVTKVLLITIPDFGVSPEGKKYSRGRNITQGISSFNEIVKAEAKKRHWPCVDIFGLSRKMAADGSLVSSDGLHPSAKEYGIWEQAILPEVIKLLK